MAGSPRCPGHAKRRNVGRGTALSSVIPASRKRSCRRRDRPGPSQASLGHENAVGISARAAITDNLLSGHGPASDRGSDAAPLRQDCHSVLCEPLRGSRPQDPLAFSERRRDDGPVAPVARCLLPSLRSPWAKSSGPCSPPARPVPQILSPLTAPARILSAAVRGEGLPEAPKVRRVVLCWRQGRCREPAGWNRFSAREQAG